MNRKYCLSGLVLALAVSTGTAAFADTYLAYSQGGIPPGADIFTWCDTAPCDVNAATVSCATPEGGSSLRMNTNVWGGFGIFLVSELGDLSAYETGDMRFFVKTPYDLKVEFQCRPTGPNVTYTKFISQHGWDGENTWQEIVIPIADFFAPDPVDLACLSTVYSPFMATIADLPFFNSFSIDYARWQTPNSHAGPSSVEVQGRQLLVDGEPFVVNAIAYAPVGIGENWQSAWRDRSDRYLIDFPLIADSGANAVRLYAPILTTAMLDAAWAEGLYVIPTFGVDSIQLECSDGKNYMEDRFVELVQQWKDHPAILFWLIGNEVNANLGSADLCLDWYPQLDAMAAAAHTAEGSSFHPVGTAAADVDDICVPGCSDDTSLPNVDLWGTQLYRGCSFGGAFNEYAGKADCARPLIVTEFGADAWQSTSHCSVTTGTSCFVNTDCPAGTCSITTTTACHTEADCPGTETCVGGEFCDGAGSEDQTMQADCLEALLDEAALELAVRTPGGVSSGQTIFEWTDEWWKAQCLPTTGWSLHDSCASFVNNAYSMDPAINEEWWGIAALVDTTDGPTDRNLRAAATRVGDAWLGPVCNMEVDAHDAATGNITISFNPAAGNAVDHNLYYGPLSAVSSYGYSGSVSGLGTTGSSSFTLPAGSLFFVVAGENGILQEGCYGTDSAGTERPCFSGNCDVDQISGWNCWCSSP